MLIFGFSLIDADHEKNFLIFLIERIKPDNNLFIVAIAGTCAVVAR